MKREFFLKTKKRVIFNLFLTETEIGLQNWLLQPRKIQGFQRSGVEMEEARCRALTQLREIPSPLHHVP